MVVYITESLLMVSQDQIDGRASSEEFFYNKFSNTGKCNLTFPVIMVYMFKTSVTVDSKCVVAS